MHRNLKLAPALALVCTFAIAPVAAQSQPETAPSPSEVPPAETPPAEVPPAPMPPDQMPPMEVPPPDPVPPAMPAPTAAPAPVTIIDTRLPPPPPAQAVYPPCTATLRDQCTQTREPGMRRAGRRG